MSELDPPLDPISGPPPAGKPPNTLKVLLTCALILLLVGLLTCGGIVFAANWFKNKVVEGVKNFELRSKLENDARLRQFELEGELGWERPADERVVSGDRLDVYLVLRALLLTRARGVPELAAGVDAPPPRDSFSGLRATEAAAAQLELDTVELFREHRMTKAEYDWLTRLIYVSWRPKNGGNEPTTYLRAVPGPLPPETEALLKERAGKIGELSSPGLDRVFRPAEDVDFGDLELEDLIDDD